MAWAADHLLHATTANGQAAIAMAPGHGGAEEIVTTGLYPAATSDGRTIVYVERAAGARSGLWTIDADGRHRRHLVSGHAIWPVVTKDDQHIIFISNRRGVQSPWQVSIEGGTPTPLADRFAVMPDVSRDGKSLLYASADEQNRPVIVVCDLPACTVPRSVMAPPLTGFVRWTPDGRGFAYIDGASGSNVWVQPLDGSSSRPLTNFTDQTITDFAWSRDGQHLAVSRATITNDIVLFKGLRR